MQEGGNGEDGCAWKGMEECCYCSGEGGEILMVCIELMKSTLVHPVMNALLIHVQCGDSRTSIQVFSRSWQRGM